MGVGFASTFTGKARVNPHSRLYLLLLRNEEALPTEIVMISALHCVGDALLLFR